MGQWGPCLPPPSLTPWGKTNLGMSWLGIPHLFMVNSTTRGYSSSLPCSHSGPAEMGAMDRAVPWSQLRAASPAVGWAGICQGTIDTHLLSPHPAGQSQRGHHPLPSHPAPPSAQEPLLLHPQSTWQGLGWLKLTFCSMGGGEQGQHQGREEQPHPGCPGAQPSCDCVGWSTAEPQHPLFAQPVPAGESKQPKVRPGEKGQR